MTSNSQISTTEPKKKNQKQKQTEQTTRTGTESQNGDHMEVISEGGRRENGRKVTGNKKHK